MLPEAHLIHHTHGRTRIRIPSRRNDEAFFEELKKGFEIIKGVAEIEVNPVTGSLLLIHALNVDTLFEHAGQKKWFQAAKQHPHSKNETDIGNGSDRANGSDSPFSVNGSIDLRGVAFLALVGLGVYQVSKGNILAQASTLFADAIKLWPVDKN